MKVTRLLIESATATLEAAPDKETVGCRLLQIRNYPEYRVAVFMGTQGRITAERMRHHGSGPFVDGVYEYVADLDPNDYGPRFDDAMILKRRSPQA